MIEKFSKRRRSAEKLLLAEFEGREGSAVRNVAYRRGRRLGFRPWNKWLIAKLQWLVDGPPRLSVPLAAAVLRNYVDGLPTNGGFRVFLSRYNRPRDVSEQICLGRRTSQPKPAEVLLEHFKEEWTYLAAGEAKATEQRQLRRVLDLEEEEALDEAVARLDLARDRDAWTGFARTWAEIKMRDARCSPKKRGRKRELLEVECEAGVLQRAVAAVVGQDRGTAEFPALIEVESAGARSLRFCVGQRRLHFDFVTAVEVEAIVTGEGAIAVRGDAFDRLLRGLHGAAMLSQNDEGDLTIRCSGYARRVITSFSAESTMSYGNTAAGELKGHRVQLPQGAVAGAASQVVGCAAPFGSDYPILEGVLVSVMDGEMLMAATDGRRLAETRTAVRGAADLAPVVLPAAVVSEMARLCGEEGTLDLVVVDGGERVVVQIGRTVIGSSLLEGDYPAYKQGLPSGDGPRVVVDRDRLARNVDKGARRANGLLRIRASDKDTTQWMEVSAWLGGGGVDAWGEEVDFSGWIPAYDFSGWIPAHVEGAMDFIVDGHQLYDALAAIPSNLVEVVVTETLAPILIRPVDSVWTPVPGVRQVMVPCRPNGPMPARTKYVPATGRGRPARAAHRPRPGRP